MTISDLITKAANSQSHGTGKRIEALICASQFGLMMKGLPPLSHGTQHSVDGSRSVTMDLVVDATGQKMIRACADPELFHKHYPGSFNATMSGKELVEMATRVQEPAGILICSATSLNSFPIYRDRYAAVLQLGLAPARRWWQFWRG